MIFLAKKCSIFLIILKIQETAIMKHPWHFLIRNDHMIPFYTKFIGLRCIVKIPSVKKIFSPWHIILCHHQKTIHGFNLCINRFFVMFMIKEIVYCIQMAAPQGTDAVIGFPHYCTLRHFKRSDHSDYPNFRML